MPRVPLFGLGQASKSPYVTAKQITNLYCEQRPQGEKSSIVAYGTPGKTLFCDLGLEPARGATEFPKGGVSYVVQGSTFWEVTSTGGAASRGSLLTGIGRVSITHNGVQVFMVDGAYGYVYDTSTATFSRVVDTDFPLAPATCCYVGRRFVVSLLNSGRFYWSDIDDGTAWDALNFANAESSPDYLSSVYASNGQLILLGSDTTEFWSNSGVADPAYVPSQGNVSEWGLAARWSLVKYDNAYACLMKNRMGQVMVAQMNGYLPKKISTVDMDGIINGYSEVSDASGYSYMLGGHPMYVIVFPTAGYTWLFDGSTGVWSKLKTFGLTRDRGEFSFTLGQQLIVTDFSDGKLYALDQDALTDNTDAIEREIIGETVAGQDGQFLPVDTLRLDMEVGIGTTTGQGVNPQISLSVSRDNGKTFGAEMWKTIGALGEYRTRVEWRRLGTTRYFTPKIRVTDPVRTVFVSACLNPVN